MAGDALKEKILRGLSLLAGASIHAALLM